MNESLPHAFVETLYPSRRIRCFICASCPLPSFLHLHGGKEQGETRPKGSGTPKSDLLLSFPCPHNVVIRLLLVGAKIYFPFSREFVLLEAHGGWG